MDRRTMLAGLAGLAGLAATSALTLAGCGDSGGAESPPSPNSTGASSPSGTAPTSPPSGTRSSPFPSLRPTRTDIVARFRGRTARRWQLNTPGEITRLGRGHPGVALTFDACGGPGGGSGYDASLIATLRAHQVRATLFLNRRWIAANPSIAQELAADPLFALANHGDRHVPLSTDGRRAYGIRGTSSVAEVYDEVLGCAEWLDAHRPGQPVFFRSGTAYADEVAVQICAAMGMPFAGFAVNGDAGATFTARQVAAALRGVRPGDVVISHMNRPAGETAQGYLAALPEMLDRGLTFVHLAGDAAPTPA